MSRTERVLPTQHGEKKCMFCVHSACVHLGGPEKDGKEAARVRQEYTGGQELCGREIVGLSVSTIRK